VNVVPLGFDAVQLVYVFPKLKCCVNSKQKKMIGVPFQIPEKAPMGTLLADGAVTLNVSSPFAKPIVWSISAWARDVMHSAPSAATANTARRASI
jgi:hypothetical protein